MLVPVANSAYQLAVPWTRADIAGAADFIQTHRQPDECVVANHWEYVYYFRHDADPQGILEKRVDLSRCRSPDTVTTAPNYADSGFMHETLTTRTDTS